MNEKQVKKWAVVSFVICFILWMVPTIWSSVGEVTVIGTIATAEERMGSIVVASLILILLIFMIYSDNVLRWLDKTRIGKWINTPASSYKE